MVLYEVAILTVPLLSTNYGRRRRGAMRGSDSYNSMALLTMAGVGVVLCDEVTTQLHANSISGCEGGGVHVVGARTTEVSSKFVR